MHPTPISTRGAGVRLAALDYRTPSGTTDGPTVVVLHGIRDNAWSFHPVAKALSARFPTISLDLRGHGDSEAPGAYSFALMVADLSAAQEDLGLTQVILVAHSLGAQISAHYAALFPERMAGLVIAEGLGPLRPASDAATQQASDRSRTESLITLPQSQRRLPDLADAVARLRRNHPRLSLERAAYLATTGTRPHQNGGLEWKWDPRIQSIWLTGSSELLALRWTQIRCPTLVVTAELGGEYWHRRGHYPIQQADTDNAEIQRRIATFCDAQHSEVRGVGHMIHYEEPVAFANALVPFLARFY
ncbi:MAG: alpha/beta hydrolase [Gammaproteobacteria bacterium]|nr:alpha/beta hydrolase [Gammaproteobacteria bacterium]